MISAWLTFLNFGPYHLCRLNACEMLPGFRFVPVSIAMNQAEYSWRTEADSRIQFIERERYLESVRGGEWCEKLEVMLRRDRPDVVFVAGYSHPAMLSLIKLCASESIPWILMSDSRSGDSVRRGWQESVKKRVVRLASAGLVAGSPHADYLAELGMPRERIAFGYDVVDNHFFSSAASEFRQKGDLPCLDHFFLASNRFIEVKNLLRLIRAYAIYSARVLERETGTSAREGAGALRSMVFLGDGPMRSQIESLSASLGLRVVHRAPWEEDGGERYGTPTLYLPGFRQIEELPRYYAQATAFILASTSETWGLVVNEAMASSLPVLVSKACGCASDLVQDGMNGWTFDPMNEVGMADLLEKVGALPTSRRLELGLEGQRIIEDWGPSRFAKGCQEAMENASRIGPIQAGVLDRMLLTALIRR